MDSVVKIFFLLALSRQTQAVSLSCDFEHDFCGWYQLKDDELEWNRSSSGTPDRSSGPIYDHTSGGGYFAYVTSAHARLDNASAGMITPQLLTAEQTTLKFWYHMNGIGIGSLVVLTIDTSGFKKEVWRKTGRQGVGWNEASLDLQPGAFKVCILATARHHFGSDLAIDDIVFIGHVQVLTTPPPPTTPESLLEATGLNCDFENSFCGWRQDSNDQFDWRRTSADTPDKSSGPLSDHTTGNGSFAFINGHEVIQTFWISRILSPTVQVRKHTSLKFWYHMNGRGIGSLAVNNILVAGSERLLFKVSGRQGPDWNEGRIDLSPGVYKLSIEASVRLHYGSDIAIDDITVV